MSEASIADAPKGASCSDIPSRLFAAKSLPQTGRESVELTIHSQPGMSVVWRGEALNQYDEQILTAIRNKHRSFGLHVGSLVIAKQSEILAAIGKNASGDSYIPFFEGMRRMCSGTITIQGGETTKTVVGHIVDSFHKDSDGRICFRLNPDIAMLFEGDRGLERLQCKVVLDRLLAKWIYDWALNQPMSYSYGALRSPSVQLKKLIVESGYAGSPAEFTRQLKLACKEIVDKLDTFAPFNDFAVYGGEIQVFLRKKPSEIAFDADSCPFEE